MNRQMREKLIPFASGIHGKVGFHAVEHIAENSEVVTRSGIGQVSEKSHQQRGYAGKTNDTSNYDYACLVTELNMKKLRLILLIIAGERNR